MSKRLQDSESLIESKAKRPVPFTDVTNFSKVTNNGKTLTKAQVPSKCNSPANKCHPLQDNKSSLLSCDETMMESPNPAVIPRSKITGPTRVSVNVSCTINPRSQQTQPQLTLQPAAVFHFNPPTLPTTGFDVVGLPIPNPTHTIPPPSAQQPPQQPLLQRPQPQPQQQVQGLVVMESMNTWIHDIDAEDRNEPHLCAEYVHEIYGILLQKEKKEREWIIPYLGELQRDINRDMRSILVDWLVEVVEEYTLSTDTLFLAVNYIDRFLSAVVVPRSRLQLVGIACTLVASKYEDIYAPTVEDFVYISDSTYKREEILVMESQILNVLRFRLTVTTVRLFLKRFLKAACADHTINASHELPLLANYLSELSLLSYELSVHYEPSLIATACIVVALHTLNLPRWTATLAYYTEINKDDPKLQSCIRELVRHYQSTVQPGNPVSQLNAIREKYQALRHVVPPAASPW